VYFNTSKLLISKGHLVRNFAMKYKENVKSYDESYFTQAIEFDFYSFWGKLKHFIDFFYNRKASKDIEKLIIDFEPDVAHIHLFYGSLTSSILAKFKKFKIPVVITAHDYRLICPAYRFLDGKNEICEKCRGKLYYKCFVNKCAKKSFFLSFFFSLEAYFRDFFFSPHSYISKFIFVSKFSKSIHLKYKPTIKNKAVQIYNFQPDSPLETMPCRRGNYFLYFGRLSFEKGLLTLMEAVKQCNKYELKISGDGPLLNLILEDIKENISYCGFNTGKQLEDLIKNCSYVVVPSEWYETFGMVILEAYSLGKPVIAADIGGIPEIVLRNETGFLFNPFSIGELVTVMDHAYNLSDSEYDNMSRKAFEFANQFRADKHYEELMNVYKTAIKN
jgi:glycosyltransferase involved in cell wall biosynthesis